MPFVRKIPFMRIAVAAVAIVILVILCFAIAGWRQMIVLQDGLELGFDFSGSYDCEGPAGPPHASFAVKQCDGYDGFWQVSNAESGSAFKSEEGWLRQTEAPNLYILIGQDGKQRGWVAVSGLKGIFGKGQRIVVEYDSMQSWFSCISLVPSREGPEFSAGYASSSLDNLNSGEWFDVPAVP